MLDGSTGWIGRGEIGDRVFVWNSGVSCGMNAVRRHWRAVVINLEANGAANSRSKAPGLQ